MRDLAKLTADLAKDRMMAASAHGTGHEYPIVRMDHLLIPMPDRHA
jgi:hypothetical protein